jgi:hypothetical protein
MSRLRFNTRGLEFVPAEKKKRSPQIPMSLRLAKMNENAQSALECGREAAAFGSFPSAHARKTCETKAVAAATAVHQSAFGTGMFMAARLRKSFCYQSSAPLRLCGEGLCLVVFICGSAAHAQYRHDVRSAPGGAVFSMRSRIFARYIVG